MKTIINAAIALLVIWLLLSIFFGLIWPILVILGGSALIVVMFYWLYKVVINAFNLESTSGKSESSANSNKLPEKDGWDFSNVQEADIVD